MITCVVDYTIDPAKLAEFERFARRYRQPFERHPDFVAADRIRDESGSVLRYERTFMRPLLPD